MVQSYLLWVGVAGKEAIHTVRLKQKGFLRLEEGQKWLPMQAEQYFTTNPPAFAWYARIKSSPFLTISVTDTFTRGHGRLLAKLSSVITMADAKGPEVDQGELLRYLAETIWFPTAWLADYIQWEEIDANSAKATLWHAGQAVAAVFHFNDGGQTEVTAERYRAEKGKFLLQPWSGRVEDCRDAGGLRIPMRAEASWQLESGAFTYFQAEITNIEYNV